MSSPENLDGRRAKGQRRRRAIIDATLRVVERDGVASVSHRNIAREAGVPPASIAYYFASIDELLVATLLECADAMVTELDRIRQATDSGLSWASAVARMLASMASEHRGRTIAEYELYLLAARRPALRPAARRWIEVASGYFGDADAAAVTALVSAIDGMLMQALIADEPPRPESLEPALTRLMESAPGLRNVSTSPAEV